MRSIVPAFVLLLLLTGCHRDAIDPRTRASLVRAVIPAPAPPAELRLTGVVRARVESDLGFRVAGKVVARSVDAGQTVKRGQVLMRLDPNDLTLAATSRAFELAATRARLDQAEADLRRLQGLVDAGATSAKTYDEAVAAAAGARAQWAAAQAQSTVASNARSYAVLVADSDGVVQETMAEPGQVVSAGQPVVKLAHAGPREAVIDLPERYRPSPGSTVRASLYGGEGTAYSAVLRQVSQAADPVTRTYPARYVLQGPGEGAPLGATVTVTVRLDAAQQASAPPLRPGATTTIPIGALYDPGTGPGVWAIANDRVRFTRVEIASLGVETATVLGIEPGTRIVALGADRLREGQPVRTADSPVHAEPGQAVP